MSLRNGARLLLLLSLLAAGLFTLLWAGSPAPETTTRQQAVQQVMAPARGAGAPERSGNELAASEGTAVVPVAVNVQDLPAGPAAFDQLLQQYLAGQIDLEAIEGPVSGALFQSLLEESLKQDVSPGVQVYEPGPALLSNLTGGASFKAIDYTQSQQGVPPDPDITVGKDHIIVAVNTSFQVFDKAGNSLVGPTLFSSFWGSNCGTGSGVVMFDPYVDYDEKEGRYILGITAYDPAVNGGDNGWACIAVSQADNAAGSYWLYSFDGNPGGGADYFFDYPHLGVGQSALYLSANMFGASFVRNHVFAYDKFAMYAGAAANSIKFNVGSGNFTLQPAKVHGFANGGWPTNPNEPHYFVDAQYGNNQNTLTVWQMSDPFGSGSLTQAGTVTVNSYSLSVSQPQLGGSSITGNDDRLLDVKYWGGKLYATHHIGCNPGGGTVNCIRWYIIDISSGSPVLFDQGTFASAGEYRSFPAIAPNACGDLLVGYTKMSSSMYPSVYVAGREAGDPAGLLKQETLLHAGEDFYTAYDSVPRRWGDYTGMAIDPDGQTFWYLGEYSRNQATARWSTWVGSYTWPGCSVGPTPTPGPTAIPTNTPPPTATPPPTTCTVYNSSDVPIGLPNGVPAISSNLSVSGSSSIVDINASINMDHAWVGDLIFNLTHQDSATTVTLIDQPGVPASTYGCSGDDIVATLDDEAGSAVENECASGVPTINGTFTPNGSLASFDGQSGNGVWTLEVLDTYTAADAGTLNAWSVEICVAGDPPPTPTNTPVPPPTDTPAPPTPTSTPTSTPVPPTPTNTPVPQPTNTPPPPPTATNTPPPPTPTHTPVPGGDPVLYVSSTSGGSAGGVSFSDEDILAYDTGSGVWSMYLDGSDVGLSGSSARDVNAFYLMDDGSILLSFVGATTIPDVGAVDDSDIVRFVPTSLGTATAGSFEVFFDGSDVGLSSSGEDVDAIGFSTDGKLVISTIGSHSVTGVSGADEDLLIFTATSLGASTSGTWARYFDGSDVGLGGNSSEDVYGISIGANGDIYLTTRGAFSVTGASGTGTDILRCVPGSLGDTTSCSFTLFWDGSANGYGSELMDGLHIVD